jgi:hypothetical protein
MAKALLAREIKGILEKFSDHGHGSGPPNQRGAEFPVTVFRKMCI